MKIKKKSSNKFEKETINLEGKKITCIMEIKKRGCSKFEKETINLEGKKSH